MSTATKKLRALVFARAKGRCECNCGRALGESGHLDHMFGRARVPEAFSNCWALALSCDAAKTNNYPSAAFWLRRFRAHCRKHGFGAELDRADARMAVLAQKGFAA